MSRTSWIFSMRTSLRFSQVVDVVGKLIMLVFSVVPMIQSNDSCRRSLNASECGIEEARSDRDLTCTYTCCFFP